MEKYNIKSLKYSNEPNKELLQKNYKDSFETINIIFFWHFRTIHCSLAATFSLCSLFSFVWQRVTSGLSENQDT